jgi:hypothetical protein
VHRRSVISCPRRVHTRTTSSIARQNTIEVVLTALPGDEFTALFVASIGWNRIGTLRILPDRVGSGAVSRSAFLKECGGPDEAQ